MYQREQTLSYARALRSFHLFSSLLKGDKFHAYLTDNAKNAVPRSFAFLTYSVPNLRKLERTLESSMIQKKKQKNVLHDNKKRPGKNLKKQKQKLKYNQSISNAQY